MLTLFHIIFNQFTILMVAGLAISFLAGYIGHNIHEKQKMLATAYDKGYSPSFGRYETPNVSAFERMLKIVCWFALLGGAYMFFNNVVGFLNSLYLMFS